MKIQVLSYLHQIGVETNQLLEIRKLEDRQAEEWKALNLPKINNVSKNSTTKSSNTSLKVKRAEFQSSNDPNLEIALALSASMASNAGESIENKNEKVEDIKSETVQYVGYHSLHQTQSYQRKRNRKLKLHCKLEMKKNVINKLLML